MIYLDNAATSYPKPPQVTEAIGRAVATPWGNPGRSGHRLSREAAEAVYGARSSVARLVGLKRCENLVFCGGATQSLNMAILGLAAQWPSQPVPVVTSVLEHNSVLRPLYALARAGRIRLESLPLSSRGEPDLSYLERHPPRFAVLTAQSNTTGRCLPLRQIAEILHQRGGLLVVDGAQAVGGARGTFAATGADLLCGAGHKGLFGMMGGGFLAVSETCPVRPTAILTGGSGNTPFSPEMPELLPEGLEAGTLPLIPILSMGAGADFLWEQGLETVSRWERARKAELFRGLRGLSAYVCYDPDSPDGPLLLNHRRRSPEELADALEERGILARAGFHCAPLAHAFWQTGKNGALRLSCGFFTQPEETEATLAALTELA